MIKFTEGDIFNSSAYALVNPVNTQGVMGHGLARQFADRYPEMEKEYQKFCADEGFLANPFQVYKLSNSMIINYPTQHKPGQGNGDFKLTVNALEQLALFIKSCGIKSVAIPKLGAGIGGLNWNDVLTEIVNTDEFIKDKETVFYIYNNTEEK